MELWNGERCPLEEGIEEKYENRGGGWCTKLVSRTNGVSVWKSIRSGRLDFSKFLRFDVGDDTRAKF